MSRPTSTAFQSRSDPHASLQPWLESEDFTSKAFSIVVLGASGHLARTQVIPAIFSLYCKRLLPKNFHLFGYARSEETDSQFRSKKIEGHLKGYESHEKHNMKYQYDHPTVKKDLSATITSGIKSIFGTKDKEEKTVGGERTQQSDSTLRKSFLSRCYYVRGKYDEAEGYQSLLKRMEEVEKENNEGGLDDEKTPTAAAAGAAAESKEQPKAPSTTGVNRLYYLSIPPSEFSPALANIAKLQSSNGWTRVVVEKPFGEDLASARKLNQEISSLFKEKDVYRIDHFMGKETTLDIIPLRFSNITYRQIWSREHISSVMINFKEEFGLEGRAGYYDESGIIRDMIQNHLLSLLALLTMEEPDGHNEESLHKAKYNIFNHMKPILEEDIIIGQYGPSEDKKKKAYKDEADVKQPSKTLTYVCIVVHIDNDRWRGVPLVLNCGKALDESKSEITIQFKPVQSKLFESPPANRLLFHLSPHPSLTVGLNIKSPGIDDQAMAVSLELNKKDQLSMHAVPEAYERLIFDVIRGNRTLFVTAEEVEAAWFIVDPVLKRLEADGNRENAKQPYIYPFGSHGPTETNKLLQKYQLPIQVQDL